MSVQSHVEVDLKASYRTLNKLTKETKSVWIVFHGYGQIAEFFIKKFSGLNPSENFIIAPQGLSKFYQAGFSGRVGATWMTKEDRLVEIENQHRYLDAVLKKEICDCHAEIVLLGFSQGASTMIRYAAHVDLPIHKMIIWAGTIPPELVSEDVAHWPKFEGHFLIGDKDEFNKNGHFNEEKSRFESLIGRPVQETVFAGKHEVIPELIMGI